MAATIKQSLRDQLSTELQQRQGVDTTIKKIVYQAVSQESPQDVRKRNNGRLNTPRTPLLDVYADEINGALQLLNTGDFTQAARISALALSTDGWISGVFGTFTASITSLPRKFVGDQEIKRDLSVGYAGIDGDPRSLFDAIVRPSVFSSLLVDCRMLGVGVGELSWLPDLDYPIVARLDPQFLRLDRYSNTWMFLCDTGKWLEITPGDGRWILLTPGGASEPWHGGIWAAVARDYSRKTEALLNLDAWQRKNASPIRLGTLPAGAIAQDYDDYLDQLIEWSGTNTSAVLPPGYDAKLLETNGVGYQAYVASVKMANESLTVAIAGQLITTTGSQGFANGDMGLTIRGDLTKRYACDIANDITDQVLPYVVASRYGSVDRKVALVLETDPPKDKAAVAQAVITSSNAITAVVAAYQAAKAAGLQMDPPDVHELMQQLGIPQASPGDLPAPTALPALPASTPESAPEAQ
jgi:hypothetical protein